MHSNIFHCGLIQDKIPLPVYMDKPAQRSTSTEYNRYARIFEETTRHVSATDPNVDILSFGCSTGEEVRSLAEIYYPVAKIDGYDIQKDIIRDNKKQNKNSNIQYWEKPSQLRKYDLVFCMSVLCIFPPRPDVQYEFEHFNQILKEIDQHVKVGGYIVIYNSAYRFFDSDISYRYVAIHTQFREPLKQIISKMDGDIVIKVYSHTESGFVQKTDRDGKSVNSYPHYMFRKEKDADNDPK